MRKLLKIKFIQKCAYGAITIRYERKCDALFDIDGRGNTERLVARNPKLKNLLKDGEYIPSLGQLNLMAHYMDELNKAFAYVSASPLSSTWYRSSTESSPSVAWYVDFSIGSAYYSDKYNSSRVRAVIDFYNDNIEVIIHHFTQKSVKQYTFV